MLARPASPPIGSQNRAHPFPAALPLDLPSDGSPVRAEAPHRPRAASESAGVVSEGVDLGLLAAQNALRIHLPAPTPQATERGAVKRKPESDDYWGPAVQGSLPPAVRGDRAHIAAPPDVVRLAAYTREMPVLRADGIREVNAASPELRSLRIQFDIAMDSMRTIVANRQNMDKTFDALSTSGVATCYVVAAIGSLPGNNNMVVITLGHFSPFSDAESSVEAMGESMTALGVVDWQYFVAGGQASLYGNEAEETPMEAPGSLDEGLAYIEAGGDRVRAARIGLSETEELDVVEAEGFVRAPSTGRPEAVTVVFTSGGMMYYCPELAAGTQVPGMPPQDPDPA